MGPVRVVDGSGQLDATVLGLVTRGDRELLERITVSQASTCYQMASLLSKMPANRIHFVVLDMLEPFRDGTIAAGERKMLLGECLMQLGSSCTNRRNL